LIKKRNGTVPLFLCYPSIDKPAAVITAILPVSDQKISSSGNPSLNRWQPILTSAGWNNNLSNLFIKRKTNREA
jgi:hypothetical protein